MVDDQIKTEVAYRKKLWKSYLNDEKKYNYLRYNEQKNVIMKKFVEANKRQ